MIYSEIGCNLVWCLYKLDQAKIGLTLKWSSSFLLMWPGKIIQSKSCGKRRLGGDLRRILLTPEANYQRRREDSFLD